MTYQKVHNNGVVCVIKMMDSGYHPLFILSTDYGLWSPVKHVCIGHMWISDQVTFDRSISHLAGNHQEHSQQSVIQDHDMQDIYANAVVEEVQSKKKLRTFRSPALTRSSGN